MNVTNKVEQVSRHIKGEIIVDGIAVTKEPGNRIMVRSIVETASYILFIYVEDFRIMD